ncbi:hypothetical protein LTR53_007923 [Teratosphaeriaceae sp. CCFEE 6253]|nr:hypothetical protein LTR53_007923 [Teratosphaeriaceae sp. CCFEE 6253]
MSTPTDSVHSALTHRKRKRGPPSANELYDLTSDSDRSTHSDDDGLDSDLDMADIDLGRARIVEVWDDTTGPGNAGAEAPAYDEQFDDIEAGIKKQVAKVVQILERHRHISARLQDTLDQTQRLMQPIVYSPLKVLLVGASGAGKSSTLNSILDQPGLARTLSSGERCTDVPTLYEGPFPGQSTPYAARVVFLSESDIRDLMRDLLEGYCIWHFHSRDGWEPDQRAAFERRASTAFQAFRGLFRDIDDFSTDESARLFLQTSYHDDTADTVAELCSYCSDLLPASHWDGAQMVCQKVVQADSKEELRMLLQPFNSSTESSHLPLRWCLVDRIRILRYLTIADAPRSTDTDILRARAFERLLDDFDELWTADRIGRIVSEDPVSSMLYQYGSYIKSLVIATRSEESADDDLIEYFQNQQKDVFPKDHMAQLQSQLDKERVLEQKKAHLLGEIARTREKHDGRSSKRSRSAITQQPMSTKHSGRLEGQQTRLDDLNLRLHEAGLVKMELIVRWRNQCVARLLSDKYSRYLPAHERLQVHCISNADYASHHSKKDNRQPRLSVPATGIPDLRKHVYDAIAPKVLQTLDDHINTELLPFAGGLALLVTPANLPGHEDAIRLVDVAGRRLRALVEAHQAGLPLLVSDMLTAPLVALQRAHAE